MTFNLPCLTNQQVTVKELSREFKPTAAQAVGYTKLTTQHRGIPDGENYLPCLTSQQVAIKELSRSAEFKPTTAQALGL